MDDTVWKIVLPFSNEFTVGSFELSEANVWYLNPACMLDLLEKCF